MKLGEFLVCTGEYPYIGSTLPDYYEQQNRSEVFFPSRMELRIVLQCNLFNTNLGRVSSRRQ